jgi:hypothetical protein
MGNWPITRPLLTQGKTNIGVQRKNPFPKQDFNPQASIKYRTVHTLDYSHSDQPPNIIRARISKRMTWVQNAACI